MSWGGKRPGAGRPKGAICKSTRAILEAYQSGGEMPIEYLLRVMRDANVQGPRRDTMALAAAAYLHVRIARITELADEAEATETAPPENGAVNDGA